MVSKNQKMLLLQARIRKQMRGFCISYSQVENCSHSVEPESPDQTRPGGVCRDVIMLGVKCRRDFHKWLNGERLCDALSLSLSLSHSSHVIQYNLLL
jgi:hypothetical protein